MIQYKKKEENPKIAKTVQLYFSLNDIIHEKVVIFYVSYFVCILIFDTDVCTI